MARAIAAVGGVVKTAALCGVSPQAVSQWTRVPPAHAAKLAAESGIPAHELRPDVFPAPLGPRDPVATSVGE